MRHGKISSRLGVKADHRVAMLRNLARGLVQNGRIKTTLPRAKKLRPFLEPIVTRLKNPTVANLRIAVQQLNDREAVLEIAKNIAPKLKDRPGGYLRILKLATPRAGDAADMALIEWVDESLVPFYNEGAEGKKPAAKAKKAAKKVASKKASEGGEKATKKEASKKKTKESK